MDTTAPPLATPLSSTTHAPSTLELPPDEMRALGYRVVDMIVAHHLGLRDQPVSTMRSRADLEAALSAGFPAAPTSASEVLDIVARDVLSAISHTDHPRFFAFVPGPANFVGAMADALAAGFNVFAGHWLAASGPAAVELQTIRWLADACGLPATAGGLFVSGGSMANLTALATARRINLGEPDPTAVVYCSAQTHNSLAKGLRVLGFGDDQLRTVGTDDDLRLSLPALRAAIATDRIAGRRPFCVIANAGTTNTGAVDPLPEIADICNDVGMWLHVDGAYGAAAVLTERGREALRGIERADSITLDPHKWLFQPFEIGCLLVRDVSHLRATFAVHPEDHGSYLEDVTRVVERDVVFYEHGVQLTRSFRALKLWMTLRVFGTDAFRQAIERGMAMAEETERLIRAGSAFAVVTPATLGVVTFTPRPAVDSEAEELMKRVTERTTASGFAMLTSTNIFGRPVLRMCTINPATTVDDIRETLAHVAAITAEARREMGV
jgi:aromatic-L-amino-acid/L-tryptophan decarboxylase